MHNVVIKTRFMSSARQTTPKAPLPSAFTARLPQSPRAELMKVVALALLALVAASAAQGEFETRSPRCFVAAFGPLTPGLPDSCRR